MHSTRKVITTFAAAAVVSALAAVTMSAQGKDSRWDAWIGCWAPVAGQDGMLREMGGAGSTRVCVAPAEGTSAVEVLTIASSGKLLDRTRIEADGAPHAISRDGCNGTETARWASHGTRVYISTQLTCAGGVQRRGTGVMSFNQRYEWLDVRGMSSSDVSGVAVARYSATDDTTGIPADVRKIVPVRTAVTNMAALAASAPLTLADITDVGTVTDSGVASTWLTERTQGVRLTINGKQLEALADQGVPAAVIDVVVAIAHPEVFVLNPGAGDAGLKPRDQRVTSANTSAVRGMYGYPGYYSSVLSSGFPFGFAYGWSPYYGMYDPMFGYGYGSYGYGMNGYRGYSPYGSYGSYSPYGGYYPGSQPIVVVTRPSDTGVTGSGHGRMVKGDGYVGPRNSGSSSGGSSSTSGGSSSGSSSGGSASTGGATTGSSSTSGGDRTAVRKPPQ